MNKKVWLNILVFVISMSLIFTGHKNVGIVGLLTMLVGLTGLLSMLYFYNKQYQ